MKVETSVTPTPTPQPGPTLRQRPFAPRMQFWHPSTSRSTSHSYTNPDYETSSEYSEPSNRKPRFRFPLDDCAVEDDPADAPAPSTEDPMAASESTKLKGVLWPGMDLFDSATPEMRRKRNQKKDSSVVEQLELNSTEVEATELIFTPRGSFKKQRRISSSVYEDEDESSPLLRTDSPKAFAGRPVLGDVDPNVSRRPRREAHPGPLYLHRGRFEEQVRSSHGHREYPLAPRKKRTFDVFTDEEVTFNHPAPFNLLTNGPPANYHRYHPSPSPAPSWPPQPKQYNEYFPFDNSHNKENLMPTHHPTCEHAPRQPASYYTAYAYGFNHGPEPTAFQYENQMYLNNVYSHHPNEEMDDQRTLTAPPSPSSG